MKRTGLLVLGLLAFAAQAQTLTGSWQIMKTSHCLGFELDDPTETERELQESMATLSVGEPKTMQFNADNSGVENWRSLGKKKSAAKEKFLYRVSDSTIYFLDKKTRLITGIFIIEELTLSSLIIFNKERSCERIELVRLE